MSRRRVIRLIHGRDVRGHRRGWGVYLTTSACLAAAALLLRNDVAYVHHSGVAVMANPLLFPFFVAVLVLSLFLALSSVTAIAREREQGTLQVLFYGPVDELGYLLGKFLAQMVVFAAMLAGVMLAIMAWAGVANLHLSLSLLGATALAFSTAAALVGGGILLSVVMGTVRGAVLAFVGLVVVSLATQVGAAIVGTVADTEALLVLSNVLTSLAHLAGVVSPFAYLDAGLDALTGGDMDQYVGYLVAGVLFGGASLGLAVLALRRRGVLR